MSAANRAVEQFATGHSCSQAVFTALAEPMGMDHETALKVSSGFGGGMGRMGSTCGAVTGAFMALGLKCGGVDSEAKDKTYRLVNRFVELFRKRHGSLECRDLIGCDLSTEEGRQQAKAKDTHGAVCTGLVRDAVEIVEELLND
jgi:C_GCAxxG_C_C family probable redox protein